MEYPAQTLAIFGTLFCIFKSTFRNTACRGQTMLAPSLWVCLFQNNTRIRFRPALNSDILSFSKTDTATE